MNPQQWLGLNLDEETSRASLEGITAKVAAIQTEALGFCQTLMGYKDLSPTTENHIQCPPR